MKLTELLEKREKAMIEEASRLINQAPATRYHSDDVEVNREKMERLFLVVKTCIAGRDATAMVEYAKKIARERFEGKFPLHEVLKAFNILEEVLWREITDKLKPAAYAESFGLVSTVFGFGKEILASQYVELTAHALPDKKPILNLSYLYKGI